MDKLIWSPKAAADLEEICQYISRDSEHYAKLFAQKVIVFAERIAEFPMAGRIVPEYQRDDLRERIFQSYRIVYRVKPEMVEIVAIVHGARLLPKLE
ncbi:MAG: type II toxin-antitoxin system RelE/ParE family toxin [Candidatus Hydrogenedentota bacterium]